MGIFLYRRKNTPLPDDPKTVVGLLRIASFYIYKKTQGCAFVEKYVITGKQGGNDCLGTLFVKFE